MSARRPVSAISKFLTRHAALRLTPATAGRPTLVSLSDLPDPTRAFEPLEPRVLMSAVTEAAAVAPVADAVVVDLSADLYKTRISGDVISGDRTNFRLPVQVRNEGKTEVPAGQLVDIFVYVRKVGATDASGDVLVQTVTDRNVGGLDPRKSLSFVVNAKLPRALESGEYQFVAQVVAKPAAATSTDGLAASTSTDGLAGAATVTPVAELELANNISLSTKTINVTQGYAKVDVVTTASDLPSFIPADTLASGRLTVNLTNTGNLQFAGGSHVDIRVYARPIGAGANSSFDILLGEKLNQSIGYYDPGASKQTDVWIRSDVAFPAGEYRIVTVVDATDCNDLSVVKDVDMSHFTFVQDGEVASEGPLVETTAKAIARWDVVPYQTFTGTMNVGVVAFHINGIERVDFEINGKTISVSAPTFNPQSGVVEYWIPVNAADYADGKLVINATVRPTQGTARIMAGDFFDAPDNGEYGLVLYANAEGSFKPAQITLKPGDSIADALMTIPSGGEILLEAGRYDIADMAGRSRIFDRWVTIRAADGVDPKDVVISPEVRRTIVIKGSKIKFENLTMDFATIERFYPYKQDLLWFNQVEWFDSNGGSHAYDRYFAPVHNYAQSWMTDSVVHDMIYGAVNMEIARNIELYNITGDVFQNSAMVVNSFVHDVDGAAIAHHTDIFQYWADKETRLVENRIAYEVSGVDVHSQHFFMRTGGGGTFRDFAFVNIDIKLPEGLDPRAKTSQFYTNQEHVIFDNVSSAHRMLFRTEGDSLPGEEFVPTDWVIRNSNISELAFQKISEVPEIISLNNELYV